MCLPPAHEPRERLSCWDCMHGGWRCLPAPSARGQAPPPVCAVQRRHGPDARALRGEPPARPSLRPAWGQQAEAPIGLRMPNPEDQRHCSLQDAAQKQNKGKHEPTKFKRTKHELNQIETTRGHKEGRASFPIKSQYKNVNNPYLLFSSLRGRRRAGRKRATGERRAPGQEGWVFYWC